MPQKSARSNKFKDTMRPEYDFSGGIRGKYVKRFPNNAVMVTLAPDADSVNEALRVPMKAAKKIAPAA